MEFHSEWLLEDPIEVLTDLNKEVYSKDEIEKLSTKENLSEIDKAYTLLENGQICQKLWVVRNLHNIMHEGRFHEIIAELINRLPYWNESSQEEAGRALIKILINNCFPVKYSEHLLNLSLQIIDSETWTLQKTWGEVVAELSKHLPEKLMLRCTQEAMNLSAFNQKDQIRSIGGIILGAIVETKKKPPGEITRKIFSMSQDPSNFVRSNMCGALRNLFRLPEYEAKVVEEILKLVGDECVEVLEESLQLFVDVLPSISDKAHVLENIEEYFVKSRFDKLTEVKLRFIGRIMKDLKDIMDLNTKQKWMDWVLSMANEGSINERRSLSISFGGILQCCLLHNKILKIWNILELQNDEKIQQNLVIQLGFLSTYGRDNTQETQAIVRKYVKGSQYWLYIIPQFTVIATCLGMQEEILQILIEKCNSQLNFRETLMVLGQLVSFVNEFNCVSSLKNIVQHLIQIGKNAAGPIKEKSLELLSLILYKSPGHSNKIALSKDIIAVFANSSSCYNRAAYLHFCLCIKNLCSKQFFCKIFMNSLLNLAKDPSSLVRYSFAKNYVTFRYLIPLNNTELTATFRFILNYYLELEDKILLNYTIAADDNLNNSSLWEASYGQASELIESQRIKIEQEEETKEMIENENLKKMQNEENFRGYRKSTKKYQATHKDNVPRQSSVKPIKKYGLSESDRSDAGFNRTMIRAVKKK